MKSVYKFILLLLAATLLLSGCAVRTVEQLYAMPKRSDDYRHLQAAIDSSMSGLEYCAPLSGENRQCVQIADLDGDGEMEYLLFAKSGSERPLRVLIFDQVKDSFVHVDTIESNGTSFEQVEYVQMDGEGGVELIIGSQLSDQVLRSVSVYSYSSGQIRQLMSTNYTKFLVVDLDADNYGELFVLRPGETETDNGVAELYGVEAGRMERSNEVDMSGPVDRLRRILIGKLHGGETAVYAASSAGDSALITDIYSCLGGVLVNVSLSNESGTSVKTLRNYYVYADDIDGDGVMELPALINMIQPDPISGAEEHELIRWYAMDVDGKEIVKMYTYHNFLDGWYMQLEDSWASRLAVSQKGSSYEFYVWDKTFQSARKVLTVYMHTGQNRDEESQQEGRFILHKSETLIYTACLEESANTYEITQESVIRSFNLIRQDWKTGET